MDSTTMCTSDVKSAEESSEEQLLERQGTSLEAAERCL